VRAEKQRAERKLADERFVENAPPEVVDAERRKLAQYDAELDALGD
jgi:valyl-tRNA synthetase